MPGPLNYTTTIAADKSADQCLALLRQYGASRISVAYRKDKSPLGITFVIDTKWGERAYEVVADYEGTREALLKAYRERRIDRRYSEPDQAARTAWRVIKDWLEANLAMIEAGLSKPEKVLLPYMLVDPKTSLYDAYDEQQPALEAAK